MQETPVWFLGREDLREKRKSYPLKYSGLENSVDCIVHGVAKSQTGLRHFHFHLGFPCGSAGKESTCNAGDMVLIPGLGRFPGEMKGYPIQYSGLENTMDYSPWGHKELDSNEWLSPSNIKKKKKNDDNRPKGIREEVTKVVIVVQSLTCVSIFVTPWTAACQVSLSLTFSQSLCKLTSIVLMMPSTSSSIFPFFFCLHPFPASESFPMSWLFPTGGQSIEPSASASVLPMNIQG